jgi:hypothetical protein
MAGLTRTAVRTRIRELLAEPDARHFTDSAINTWIDDGVRDVSIKTFCSGMIASQITTTSGIVSYAWPTTVNATAVDTIGIKSVVVQSSQVALDYVTPDQLGRVAGAGIQNMKWTSWHEKIVLSHIPTASITIEPYIWVVADQDSASGTIKLPNAYHHLVTFYGVAMGHMKRLEWDAANYMYGLYQQELDRIVNLINTKYVPEPMKEGVQDQGETP